MRTIAYAGAVLIALLLLGYWIWVPPMQEPPYELERQWGTQGRGPGEFNEPTGIAVTDGEVFVADARNHRIQKFTPDGAFLTAFGQPVEGPGHGPIAVAVHRDGTVYVASFAANRVEAWRQAR